MQKSAPIDLLCKSVDWFLYDRNLLHEKVKEVSRKKNYILNFILHPKFMCNFRKGHPFSFIFLANDTPVFSKFFFIMIIFTRKLIIFTRQSGLDTRHYQAGFFEKVVQMCTTKQLLCIFSKSLSKQHVIVVEEITQMIQIFLFGFTYYFFVNFVLNLR